MSANHDFSRRFFADFIASRIKAWHLGEGESRPATPADSSLDDDVTTQRRASTATPPMCPPSMTRTG